MVNQVVIQKNLIEYLERLFPVRCPEPTWSERDIWMRVGECNVVKHLKAKLAEQEENHVAPPSQARS